jgi:myo-inositol-1(or 4)-monophosphatase
MQSVNEILPAARGADSPAPLELVDGLARIVEEAGRRAYAMFRAGVRSWTKHGNSIVCDADLAVDALLSERLRALGPEHGWFSEETVDAPERIGRATLWVVDPIDGTRAFLAGDADWVVSVALVAHGRPIAAALHAPVSDELFVAGRGRGATRNGKPIAASAAAALTGARVTGPRPMLDRLARIEGGFVRLPRIRSLALRLARVATGELDAAVASGNSNDWDLAAADLMVHEAGGVLSGLDGTVRRYNTPRAVHGPLAAAGRDLHPALLRALVRATPPVEGAAAP